MQLKWETWQLWKEQTNTITHCKHSRITFAGESISNVSIIIVASAFISPISNVITCRIDITVIATFICIWRVGGGLNV